MPFEGPDLLAEIVAFANTRDGTMFLGFEERKALAKRVAARILPIQLCP